MFLLLCLYMQQTYFWMKNRIVLFIAGCCALLLSSCLDSEETQYELSRDCQILSFSLSNDSIPGLEDVVFTIDQVSGRIFNIDSMPYGTKLDEKVVCTVQLASTVYTCQVMQEAISDTLSYWNKEDSLDFSKPVKFVNTLWDGQTTKTYWAQVNIHQVVPDSMVWGLYKEGIVDGAIQEEKVLVFGEGNDESYYMYTQPANAGEGYRLYRSAVADGRNWTELAVAGLPTGEIRLSQMTVYAGAFYAVTEKGGLYRSADGQNWSLVENAPVIKALLGAIPVDNDFVGSGKQPSALSVVIDKEGTLVYGAMNEAKEWNEGTLLNDGFPLSGFGNLTYNSMFRTRLLVVAGRDKDKNLTNTAWVTDDGKVWVKLTDEEAAAPFDKQEGVAVVEYDDKLFMLSGIDETGKASSTIYLSRDGGINWSVSDTLVVMPQEFKARGFSSIHVDKDHYMYLFGGKETSRSNVLNQIWRGRINRLGFK
ncbi:MAG: exo-alpha-sialidase [Parabacteroides sp.]|nr:exo-alpha-sialidase [Parabacteroides sp.]